MATRENMDKRLAQLERSLNELGHMPTFTEDRVLYASVRYYYTNYSEHPTVKRLKEKFPYVVARQKKVMSRDASIELIKNYLEEKGNIPGPTENRPIYCKIKYLYENYSEDPRILELINKYPLIKQKGPSMFIGMTLDEKIDFLERKFEKYQRIPPVCFESGITSNILRFYERYPDHPRVKRLMALYPSNKVFDSLLLEYGGIEEYFKMCIGLYGCLPGKKSLPFEKLEETCRGEHYDETKPISRFVVSFVDAGCQCDRFISIYNKIINNRS